MPRCKHCKEKFTAKKFLQKICMERDECIKAFLSEIKATKWKADKAVLKDRVKTLGQYEAEAKKSFQRWIRLRDKDKPCISCNKFVSDPAGGHYFAAGNYSGLIFNEDNCHLQCNTYCNKHLSGNLLEYRKGLIKRYGILFVEKLESISDSKRDYNYTKYQLIAKKIQYDLKYKQDSKK